MKHLIKLFPLLLIFAMAPAFAQPAPQQAVKMIEDTFAESVEAVRREQDAIRKDPKVAYRLIEKLLAPHVDFELISRLVLGQHWRTATPEQRQRFVAAFRESLLNTYAVAMQEHIGEVSRHLDKGSALLTVLPLPPGTKGNRVTVRSELNIGEQPVGIDYRLFARDGKWKVYDVIIENISFVANYRTEYGGILQRKNLDDLIAQLSEHNGTTAAITIPVAQ